MKLVIASTQSARSTPRPVPLLVRCGSGGNRKFFWHIYEYTWIAFLKLKRFRMRVERNCCNQTVPRGIKDSLRLTKSFDFCGPFSLSNVEHLDSPVLQSSNKQALAANICREMIDTPPDPGNEISFSR